MATVRCLWHRRNSVGKELIENISQPKAQNQDKPGIRKTGPRPTMSHKPKGTSSGWGSQATWKSGNRPGDKGKQNHTAASRLIRTKWTQGWEKQDTGTLTHNPKVTSPGSGSHDPRTVATIQVRRQLSGVYDTVGTVQARNCAIQQQAEDL